MIDKSGFSRAREEQDDHDCMPAGYRALEALEAHDLFKETGAVG
jgi:hypothetical protein